MDSKVIKVGNVRVMVDNITQVVERESQFLKRDHAGCIVEDYYAKQDETHFGLVVIVFFVTGSTEGDWVTFYEDQARGFLAAFDMICGTIDTAKSPADYEENSGEIKYSKPDDMNSIPF